VNVTANWHLIRWMEPLLKASDAGRAVFLTSGAAWKGNAYWGGYAMSKAALNAMVQSWADEHKSTPLRANLFTPGPIRTKMRALAMPGEDPQTLDTPEQVADSIVALCLPEMTETGGIYSYPEKRFLAPGGPC
jgi:NAD(P)-dependent dehydrogenase (short-subunit alcohol dehydrogenase family)